MERDASFGNWLALRRRALRLSRAELARLVGCAAITLRKIEADERRPSRQIAERIVEHLALAPAERSLFLGAARGQLLVDRLPLPNLLAPSSVGATASQLPLPLTSLVGRTREIAAIREQLTQPTIRLLTLLGAPGIGKTRLSVTVAQILRDLFPDGVVWIPLATLVTSDQVLPTIARTVGIAERAGQPALVQLQQALRTRNILLILDNIEHVIAAAPALASLLGGTQQLKLLVTSRVALRISGEQRFLIPLLTCPPQQALGTSASWQSLARYEAIALFTQRAQAALPAFELSASNAWAVAEICRRLDGLPLAIELAAARSALLTPQEMLAQLDQRFTLLSTGARDLPVRQQTLRQAIAWSYDLLARDTQVLFRRLAVFSGGWTVASAQAVCDSAVPSISVLDGLEILLDSSLIVRQAQDNDSSRFDMLETIRVFSADQFAGADESWQLRRQHLAYYLALAEQSDKKRRLDPSLGFAELRQEQSNLRVAFAFALQQHAVDDGLRLMTALEEYWFHEGAHGEGYQWATRLLAATRTKLTAIQRAQALGVGGAMAWQLGDYRAARTMLEESAAVYRQLDERQRLVAVLNPLGRALLFQGEYAQACTVLDEAINLAQALGHQKRLLIALQGRGYAAMIHANYADARQYFEQSLAIAQAIGEQWGIAQALNNLGDVARCNGIYDQAADLYQESLARCQAQAIAVEIPAILHNLGYVALSHSDPLLAQRYFRESLTLQQERQNVPGILESLTGFGALMAYQGQPRRAAVLFGAMLAQRAAVNAPMWPAEQVEFDRHLKMAAHILGEDALRDALSEGQHLTLDEMLTYGLP